MNPVRKFTNFAIFCYARAKVTNFTFYSCDFAKIVEFTILTIFCYGSLRILHNFSSFVMLVKTDCQGGAADFVKFAKIADFTNLTIFRYCAFPIFQFFPLVMLITTHQQSGAVGFSKICKNWGFFKFNDFNDFLLLHSCDVKIPCSLKEQMCYTSVHLVL